MRVNCAFFKPGAQKTKPAIKLCAIFAAYVSFVRPILLLLLD
jgi:hypothetical protein